MTIKEKIGEIRSNPKGYFEEISSRMSISPGEDIEDLLCLLNSGAAYFSVEKFEELSNLILEHSAFKNNPEYQYYYHFSRSIYLRIIGDYQYAMESVRKAYKLGLLFDDPSYVVKPLATIGALYSASRDYESALFYIEEAIKLVDRVDDISLKADVYTSFGLAMFNTGELDSAKKANLRALDYYDKVPGKENQLNYSILIMNTGEVCLALKDDSEADSYFARGMELAEKHGFIDFYGRLIPFIAEQYYRRKNYEKAYQYMEIYINLNEKHKLQQNELRQYYDTDKMKEEILSLNILKKHNEDLKNRIKKLYDKIGHSGKESRSDETLFQDISSALNRNRMVSFYQPKWSVKEGRFKSAEALVRWIKEDGTCIYPGEFIKVIENFDLIHSLTESVVKQAFSLCRKIREEIDPHFTISINVPPFELQNFDVISLVEKEMLLNGLYPENVEIEITERTFFDQNPHSMNQLFGLKELGVKIALDDFGTGYSSLACLNRIPFDTVKVDRSLLLNASAVGKGDKMLGSIITLLHDLDYPVVVEGAEKKEQVKLLKSLGCDEIQGFYFSRAVKGKELLKLLRR